MCDQREQVQMRTAAPLDLKSVKPFKTKDEYLYAMKEDLAEWFTDLYSVAMDVDNFFEHLENGALLCRHANTVQGHMGLSSDSNSTNNNSTTNNNNNDGGGGGTLAYRQNAQPGTFQARDNISIFIGWCRRALEIKDTLLFETEDLVSRKNERNVVLGVLEVARKGARFGVLAPRLIQLEQEIDAEIELEKRNATNANTAATAITTTTATTDGKHNPSRQNLLKTNRADVDNEASNNRKKADKKYIEVDMMSLDEMVRLILSRCMCEHQYPMIRMSEGRYTHGNDMNTIFLRVLRRHVMVRTGGGWDTLESFLDRHDPCRCNSKEHRGSLAFRFQQKADQAALAANRRPIENGDARPKSSLGSTDSVPSSDSSLVDGKNRSSKNSSNRQSNILEETSTTTNTGDESSTLSLLRDVVNLIETKRQPTTTSNGKVQERSKSSSKPVPSAGDDGNRGPVRKKSLVPSVLEKTPVINSKSLCSSRESITSARRKSDFYGLSDSRRSSLVQDPTKAKVRPSSSTPNRASLSSVAARTPEKKRPPPNVGNSKNSSAGAPSKSLNGSCENLLLHQRRRSDMMPRKMTPSKSFQAYANISEDLSKNGSLFKKPTNPAPRARNLTPKRPASAKTDSAPGSEKCASRSRKSLDFSNCSHSLENLTEEIQQLHHFQSQEIVESVQKGAPRLWKPRRDVFGSNNNNTRGAKTRIPAPVRSHKAIEGHQGLKRTDSGVDITGGQDFATETNAPRRNTFFDDGDYY